MRWRRSKRAVTRQGSFVIYPRPGLVVRSAESSRMTGMRDVPVEQRAALIKAFLGSAR